MASVNLWAINTKTLQKRQITFDEAQLNHFPRVTPDGKSIVFASNRKNGFHIWQINLDGSDLRQSTDGISEYVPNVTPDGEWLIYVAPPFIPNTIWKKSLMRDEKPIRLFEGATGENFVSPDLKQMLISYFGKGATDEEKYRYGLLEFKQTDEIKDIGFHPAFTNGSNWKNDSSGFYFIDREISVNNVWLYSIADGSKQKITDFDELKINQLAVSPDGNTGAVSRGAIVSNVSKSRDLIR